MQSMILNPGKQNLIRPLEPFSVKWNHWAQPVVCSAVPIQEGSPLFLASSPNCWKMRAMTEDKQHAEGDWRVSHAASGVQTSPAWNISCCCFQFEKKEKSSHWEDFGIAILWSKLHNCSKYPALWKLFGGMICFGAANQNESCLGVCIYGQMWEKNSSIGHQLASKQKKCTWWWIFCFVLDIPTAKSFQNKNPILHGLSDFATPLYSSVICDLESWPCRRKCCWINFLFWTRFFTWPQMQ